MKKATTKKPFFDLTEGVARKKGDAFSVDDARAERLVELKLVTIEDIAEEAKAEEVTETKAKTKRKSTKKKG
jgi:hypothetical protein